MTPFMRLFESPGTAKRFRRTTWEFQRTFQTPLKDLSRFVEAITSALPETQCAIATFKRVVFPTRYKFVELFTKYSITPRWHGDDLSIEATGLIESRELLESVLSEWIDFLFVPSPKPLVICADHDEFITFFSHRKGQLTQLVDTLNKAKFSEVDDIRRL